MKCPHCGLSFDPYKPRELITDCLPEYSEMYYVQWADQNGNLMDKRLDNYDAATGKWEGLENCIRLYRKQFKFIGYEK